MSVPGKIFINILKKIFKVNFAGDLLRPPLDDRPGCGGASAHTSSAGGRRHPSGWELVRPHQALGDFTDLIISKVLHASESCEVFLHVDDIQFFFLQRRNGRGEEYCPVYLVPNWICLGAEILYILGRTERQIKMVFAS